MKTVKAKSDYSNGDVKLLEGKEYLLIARYKTVFTRSGLGYVVVVNNFPQALDSSFFIEFI